VPLLPVRDIEHNDGLAVPPRLAKLVIEKKKPPEKSEPVVVQTPDLPKPEPKPVREPEPVKPKPKAAPKPTVAETPTPAPTPTPTPAPSERQAAREKAASTGLVALADQLADLRDTPSIDSALSTRTLSNSVNAAARTERALVTSASGIASAGINTAALSTNTGGGRLADRDVTTVASPVTTAAAARGGNAGGSGDPNIDPGASGQRSRSEIEQIFDRNKAAIYALYRRALRQDPSLQGKLVLELTIGPGGDVLDCRVVSSELNAPEFEARLVQRVRLFDFGAQDVGTITTTKPIDFFPV
ncbi:MAG: AgmX/PglI C-terminal domain-containing protein, partial [Pseudomonadota bacterium]